MLRDIASSLVEFGKESLNLEPDAEMIPKCNLVISPPVSRDHAAIYLGGFLCSIPKEWPLFPDIAFEAAFEGNLD